MLSANKIILSLNGQDKWAVIEELIDHLVKTDTDLEISQKEAILKAVTEREESMSTGMENGIAIPHGATATIENIHVVLGIHRDGVPFDSFDGLDAKIVMLFVIPSNQFQQHIRTLASISRLLSLTEIREQILVAETPEDILKVLKEFEAKA